MTFSLVFGELVLRCPLFPDCFFGIADPFLNFADIFFGVS
jgi:hypothetical protein